MLKLPSSSPTTGHVNRALLHSEGALLTEQLAGAARYGKQPVLCHPVGMASIISSNHHTLLWLPWSRDQTKNNTSEMKDRINLI